MNFEVETAVAVRIAGTIGKEIEAVYNRITERAQEMFHERGEGDDVLAVEDWIAAEREMIEKPAAQVSESTDEVAVGFDLGGVRPEQIEIVLTPHNILLWSPKECRGRRVFRIVNLQAVWQYGEVSTHFDGKRLVVSGRTGLVSPLGNS